MVGTKRRNCLVVVLWQPLVGVFSNSVEFDDPELPGQVLLAQCGSEGFHRGVDLSETGARWDSNDRDAGVVSWRKPNRIGEVEIESDETSLLDGAHLDQGEVR